jgi:prepilin-type N-terminal cleavage/methylation domain-containing protein
VKTHAPVKQRPGPAGVSLIEMLIVMAIVGVITAGIYGLFDKMLETYSDQAVNARMLQTATTAMKRITQDIRGGGTFYAPACAGVSGWPTAIASSSTANSLTIVTLLDDPSTRTELASNQSRANATLGVVSVTGWTASGGGDVGYLTDGAQCARFTVTAVDTGAKTLTHNTASDAYTTGSSAYTYPMATSMVYRVGLTQTITFGLDTSDPNSTWLTRNNRRFAPDILGLTFGYLDSGGNTISLPLTAATAANIRAVTIDLRVRGDKLDSSVRPNVSGGFRVQQLTSTVQLRNFGS